MTDCLAISPEAFEQFLRERIYIHNVTAKTVYFYRQAYRAYQRHFTTPTGFIVALTESGVKPVSINTYSRALNAFFNWAEMDIKIPKVKEEKPSLKTVTEAHIKAVLTYKPGSFTQRRLWTILCLLIDTGIRIEEALTLERNSVDLDNLLLKVHGKGNKERIIPFSFEMRKILYRYMRVYQERLVFTTMQGRKLDYNTVKDDYYDLCVKLGLQDRGFHRFRHTFALNHIKRGGSVFGLQKILGHSDLETTRVYVDLQTEDF